jgi:hypothetical protein
MRNSDEKFLFYQLDQIFLIRFDAAKNLLVDITHDMTYRNTAFIWDIILIHEMHFKLIVKREISAALAGGA